MRAFVGPRAWGLLCCLAALSLRAAPALAASGNALVITDSTYAGLETLASCRSAVDAVLPRLHQLGFAVEAAVDKPAGDTRLAIARFAQNVASMPDQPSVVYVCAEATIEEQRLFLLPADVNLQGPFDPETQGIVFPAIFNALLGTSGTVVAELAMQAHGGEQATLDALRGRLPNGLHLAVTMSDASRTGSLGQAIAAPAAALTSNWGNLVSVARAHQDGSGIALFTPAPIVPLPAPKPAPAPVATSTAAAMPLAALTASQSSPPAPSEPPPTVVLPPDSATVAPPPAKMAQLLIAQPKPKPAAPAKLHANWRLLRVQTALRDQGLYHGALSGMMNTPTVMAIRAYQISLGKSSSGTLTGPETAQLLNGR